MLYLSSSGHAGWAKQPEGEGPRASRYRRVWTSEAGIDLSGRTDILADLGTSGKEGEIADLGGKSWSQNQAPRQAPLPLCPSLREDQARLDGLAQADLIRQQRPLRQGRIKGKQGSFDLMRIEVYLGIDQCPGEPLRAVGGAPFGQLVSEVFGVVVAALFLSRLFRVKSDPAALGDMLENTICDFKFANSPWLNWMVKFHRIPASRNPVEATYPRSSAF